MVEAACSGMKSQRQRSVRIVLVWIVGFIVLVLVLSALAIKLDVIARQNHERKTSSIMRRLVANSSDCDAFIREIYQMSSVEVGVNTSIGAYDIDPQDYKVDIEIVSMLVIGSVRSIIHIQFEKGKVKALSRETNQYEF